MHRLLPIPALLLLAAPAMASPWTLGRGQLVVGAALDHQYADREYFERGGARRFPLRGRYQSTNYRIASRVGLTDRIELELAIPFRQVSYESDDVLLLPYAGDGSGFDYYQENIIDLGQDRAGIGDLEIAGRHAFVKGSLALATELRLKTPTGYDAPSGTFGDQPKTQKAFLDDPGRYVAPENVRDDVTLGDGQLDISASLLVGYGFASGTFARSDIGYNLRLDGAADQALASLKIGQSITDRFLVYAESRAAISVEKGRVIGISVAAEDPSLPASEYGGLDNLVLRELRLERDALDVGGGLLLRLHENVELSAGFIATLWGHNTAATRTFYSGLSARTDLGGG